MIFMRSKNQIYDFFHFLFFCFLKKKLRSTFFATTNRIANYEIVDKFLLLFHWDIFPYQSLHNNWDIVHNIYADTSLFRWTKSKKKELCFFFHNVRFHTIHFRSLIKSFFTLGKRQNIQQTLWYLLFSFVDSTVNFEQQKTQKSIVRNPENGTYHHKNWSIYKHADSILSLFLPFTWIFLLFVQFFLSFSLTSFAYFANAFGEQKKNFIKKSQVRRKWAKNGYLIWRSDEKFA